MPKYCIEPGSELDRVLDEIVESIRSGVPMDPERAKLIKRGDKAVITALGIRGLALLPGSRVHASVSVEETWYGGLAECP
jgi:hypothetical protein